MKQFRSILVHVDTRSEERALFQQAVELAQAHQAALTVVEVVPDFHWGVTTARVDFEEMHQLLVEKKTAAVEQLATEASRQGVAAAAKVLHGKTSIGIITEVVQKGHDLVMKSAKGPESRGAGFLGTTATRLMRFCPCPVWAFRPPHSPGKLRVVAAVDAMPGDERHARLNQDILDVAYGVSSVPPDVVYAWSVYGERLIKDYMKRDEYAELVAETELEARKRLNDLLRPRGLTTDSPQVHLLKGAEGEQIARFVEENSFDALVIGTVGRSGVSAMFIGNTAEMLLGRVACSVIAVKPAEFVSPVTGR